MVTVSKTTALDRELFEDGDYVLVIFSTASMPKTRLCVYSRHSTFQWMLPVQGWRLSTLLGSSLPTGYQQPLSGLESWLSSYKCMLLLQRTPVQFSATTLAVHNHSQFQLYIHYHLREKLG